MSSPDEPNTTGPSFIEVPDFVTKPGAGAAPPAAGADDVERTVIREATSTRPAEGDVVGVVAPAMQPLPRKSRKFVIIGAASVALVLLAGGVAFASGFMPINVAGLSDGQDAGHVVDPVIDPSSESEEQISSTPTPTLTASASPTAGPSPSPSPSAAPRPSPKPSSNPSTKPSPSSAPSPTVTVVAPGAPTSVKIVASGYAPATLTLSWAAPSDTGGGTISQYNWAMTSGSTETDARTSTSLDLANKPAGTYAFKVQACNSAGCGAWATSASVTVSNPPPPPTTVTLSRGAKNTATSTAFYFHIEARSFSPNVNFSVSCYSAGTSIGTTSFTSNGSTRLKFDGSGNYSGDIACWDGYSNVDWVVINGVTSNKTSW